jgi:biofilm protein TabA
MNKLILKSTFIMLVAIIAFHLNAIAQQTAQTWTKEKAIEWFNSGTWQNGLKLKANEATDKLEFAIQYHKNKALWDKAFAFLRETNLDTISKGKHVIDGDNLFASVTEGPTKAFENTKWESHKKYIDLQYIIKGKEKMGVISISKATLTGSDEAKDNYSYDADGGQFYVAEPGTFLLFFPQDVHRPSIKVEGYDTVRKIVLKIRVN